MKQSGQVVADVLRRLVSIHFLTAQSVTRAALAVFCLLESRQARVLYPQHSAAKPLLAKPG